MAEEKILRSLCFLRMTGFIGLMKVKIYKPAKNAMQSGVANTKDWVVETEKENTRYIEPIMGWTGNSDMKKQLKFYFATKEAAIDFAERSGHEYEVIEPKQRKFVPKSYASNFQ